MMPGTGGSWADELRWNLWTRDLAGKQTLALAVVHKVEEVSMGPGSFYAMPVHSCTIPSSLLLNPHFRTLRNLKAQRGWQTSRGPHSVFSGRAGIRTCISCLVAGVFPTKPLFPDEVILDRTASHTLSEPQCGMWGRPRMRGTLASTVLFFCL